MTHPLVTQLRFTRKELIRCTTGVSAEDACRRILPMNCLSWIVGHLAAQEQYLWLENAQGTILLPEIYRLVGYGQPASTPPLDEMWDAWRAITAKADEYLDTLTPEMLGVPLTPPYEGASEDIGTSLLRNIYHYWFHTGEAHAIRQMLGHASLPQFVGGMADVRHSS
jgi:uncharacterized damage-inducible protein DinB